STHSLYVATVSHQHFATKIHTLSLHDALPIYGDARSDLGAGGGSGVAAQGWEVGCGRSENSLSGGILLEFYIVGVDIEQINPREIGRAHVLTPVTRSSRMPSSA